MRNIIIGILLINGLLIGGYFFFGKGSGGGENGSSEEYTLFAKGEYKEFAEKTTNNTSKYGELVHRRGISLLKLGRFDEAILAFEKSYADSRNQVDSVLLKSVNLMNKRDYSSAEAIIKNAKSKNIYEQSAITLVRGMNKYHQKKLKDSEKLISDSINFDPISPIGNHFLGRIYFDRKNRSKALQFFEKSSIQGLESDENKSYLLQTMVKLKSYEGVTDLVIKEDPDSYLVADSGLLTSLGEAFDKVGDGERAKKYLYSALEKEGNHSQAYKLLSSILLQEGDRDGAIDILKEGFEKDKNNTNLLVDRYIISYQAGRSTDELDSLFDSILEYLPDTSKSYEYFVGELHSNKLYEQSDKIVDRLLTINPKSKKGNALKKNIIVRSLLSAIREGVDAEKLFEEAFELYPTTKVITYLDVYYLSLQGEENSILYRLYQESDLDATYRDLYELLFVFSVFEKNYEDTILRRNLLREEDEGTDRVEYQLYDRIVGFVFEDEQMMSDAQWTLENEDFRYEDLEYAYGKYLSLTKKHSQPLSDFYEEFSNEKLFGEDGE